MRLSNWQSALALFLQEASQRQFEWGNHDCCLFAGDCILSITGVDPAYAFRNNYHGEEEAYAAILAYAGGGLEAFAQKIADEFKYMEISPAFAQRGDAALCEQGGKDTIGIIAMNGRMVMIAAAKGIAYLPLSCVKRAWRID